MAKKKNHAERYMTLIDSMFLLPPTAQLEFFAECAQGFSRFHLLEHPRCPRIEKMLYISSLVRFLSPTLVNAYASG